MTQDFLKVFDALPMGTFTGVSNGRQYIVTRQDFAAGNSQKLIAEELGGNGYISFNLYRLASGMRLYPCETTQEEVVDFVVNLRPL
ncbi:hypothetical protein AAFO92_07325 [Roseovarius sp. CAU 1744]|uniref:hypothetical protein n=1 Tax=Roseovarius sp. CAU 1744 TaxID=3140368 RepID=UPI00325A4E34